MRPPAAFPFQGSEPGEAAQANQANYYIGKVLRGRAAHHLEEALAWLYCRECRSYPTILFDGTDFDALDGTSILIYVDAHVERLKLTLWYTADDNENTISFTDGVNSVEINLPAQHDASLTSKTAWMDIQTGEVEIAFDCAGVLATLHSLSLTAQYLTEV